MAREVESDSEGWEEREASRTHSVKFSEDSTQEKDTPYVRQNTPHPKELKAKAHKLFAKERSSRNEEGVNLDTLTEEVRFLVLIYKVSLDREHFQFSFQRKKNVFFK